MKNKKTLILVFSALIFSFVFCLLRLNNASAQQNSRAITIIPPTISHQLNPGASTEGKLGIINESSTDLAFSVYVYDFVVVDNQGTPQILPYGTIENNRYSASNWIGVTPNSFTLKPHERFNFNYYIQVPWNAAPGGHYAAIVYQPLGSGPVKGSGAQVNSRVATLVYLDITGKIKEQAMITNFNAPFEEFGPVPVTTEIKNFGDLHISPTGTITVKDFLGRTVAKSNLATRNIFPGNISLVYENKVGQTWMIGRFSADLIGSYGKNNLPLIASTYFWVFPWKIAVLIILIIVAAVLGTMYWRKRKKTTLKKQGETPEQPVKTAE